MRGTPPVWYTTPVSRHARLILAALPLALVATVAPTLTAAPDGPRGEVRGAAATPALRPNPSPAAAAPPTPAPVHARPFDPDGPRFLREPMARPPASLTGYAWPLAKGRITLPFKAIPGGTRIRDGELWHDGLDIATFCGDRILAAHDGVVLAAGREFDDLLGWKGDLRPYYAVLDKRKLWDDLPIMVVVDDGNGYRSMYAHFSRITVAVGDEVRAGQLIGYEGMTGHASGCHLHYGLFSPFETTTFGVRDDIVRRLRLPSEQIARIDPLLVLPGGTEALRTRRIPKPAPSAGPPASIPDR